MIDIDAKAQEISEQLGLKEAAKRDGGQGIPASDAKSLTNTENLVMAKVEQVGWRYLGTLDEQCESVRNKLSQCENSMENGRHALGGMQSNQPPDSGDRDLAQQQYQNASTAYNQFRTDHGITRDASGDDRLAQFLWAVVIVVVESGFNSFFFKNVDPSGFVGGFSIAFGVSLINVGFAFLAGVLGLRYMNYSSPAAKVGGLVWFVACLLISMMTVALSAWFRGHFNIDATPDTQTAMQIDMQNAWKASVESFFAADVRKLFASLDSFALAMLGVLFAIGGVWKGYEFDDPYPGFGKMLRDRDEAREHKEEEQHKYENAINERRQTYTKPLTRARAMLEESSTELSVERRGMQHARAGNLPGQVSQLAHVLLSEYRGINAAGRVNLPGYFNDFPEPKDFKELGARFTEVCDLADSLQKESAGILEKCRVLRQELQNAQAA